MTKKTNKKRALFTSMLSLLLCVSMLIGSTFAWFTDEATTGVNTIVSGNLDIVLEYLKLDENGQPETENGELVWTEADENTPLFDQEALWEPGYTEVVYLRVRNAGNLALKYQLATNIKSEKVGVNQKGNPFKLSDYIQFGVINGDANTKDSTVQTTVYETREDAWKAVDGNTTTLQNYITNEYAALNPGEFAYSTMVVYMPTTVGNVANHKTPNTDAEKAEYVPEIKLGLGVFATQVEAENDSFDNTYDKDAPQLIMIGDTTYDTLAAAVEAAESGATIKLSGNHTLPAVNGKTLKFTTTDEDNYAVLGIDNVACNGSTLTFDGLIIKGHTGSDTWYTEQLAHAAKATYKNCKIIDLITTYCNSDFENCEFVNNSTAEADWYSVFDYGSNEVNITDCTFNTSASKAVKLYSEGHKAATLNITDCEFNGSFFDKAAVEIDSSSTTDGYTVNISDCTMNKFYTELWNDKSTNSVVTVDGKKVVEVKDSTELNDAISNATGPTTVVLPETGEDEAITLPSLSEKDVTFVGTKDTVIDTATTMPSTAGADLTFEGVTINFREGGIYDSNGFTHSDKVVYKDCIINGTQFLYAKEGTDFINCTFNVNGDAYAVWTYGTNATFTNCTFNCDGKAVLVYTESAVTATNTFTDCVFNDNGTISGKAAIEVGESAYGNEANYTININNCTVNGFDTTTQDANTFGGINLGTNVWGNKNLIPADRLNVVIDGVDAY